MKRGFDLLRDKSLNRSITFGRRERDRLGLTGLLPHRVATQRQMVDRVMLNLERLPRDIDRYMQLSALQERNERLFYRTVIEHIDRILPLIYTPTVGEACKEFSHITREPKGFFITPDDRGKIRRILANWPQKDIRVIVVTDGQRILGLGDLGANGMGIPVGKLALYTACAGIDPEACLPVTLDVGTNNEELRNDVLYLGYARRRLEGKAYLDLVDEFVTAVQSRYPNALIQFEDFLTPNAYALLKKYSQRVLSFNDDIQGTAAVALAGVYSSTRITGLRFKDLNIMFLGAGSAATGIADLMTSAFVNEGLSPEEARKHLWFVDVNGLVVKNRTDLLVHNLPYAHDAKPMGFVEAIDAIRPHVLIGATGAPGTFTQTVIERMSKINTRPGIFALSNPTSRAECTAEQAYSWSGGRAIFVSGSPFGPVTHDGKTHRPAQGNNAYVFPGIGLGAVACRARTLPDQLFLSAARTLAGLVRESDLDQGALYPPLDDIRKISLAIG
jgi:malate dehydrogenase (oxaloacetate-decarboxylating)(NADP+)